MRRILDRIFERPAAYSGPALALAATLGLGCADGSTEIDAKPPPSLDVAAGEASVPARSEAPLTDSSRSEALYRQLREKARKTSRETVVDVDELLRAAESEFPLEFRFSYERAKLVVFGRHEHHEAFGRLRRAAEKAIATGRSRLMLEMLRSDGAQRGPFRKLARGHSEWHQIHAALEHGDREALGREHHGAEPAIRAVPEAHAEPEALAAPRTAVLANELDRLRLVRARIGREESSVVQDGVAADAP